MFEVFQEFFSSWLGDSVFADALSDVSNFLLAGLFGSFCAFIFWLIGQIIKFIFKRSPTVKVMAATAKREHLILAFGILFFFSLIANPHERLNLFGTTIAWVVIQCIFIDIIHAAYKSKPIGTRHPIGGVVIFIKFIVSACFMLLLFGRIVDKSPIALISGVGAFMAILTIVFKDALMGLVAGVQITSEHLFEIGDWITVPNLKIEGEVIDIALITVKIKETDGIIHTVPASAFLTNSFRNIQKTTDRELRQVRYVVTVDPSSVTESEGSTNLTLWRHEVMDFIRKDPHFIDSYPLQVKTTGMAGGFGLPVEIVFTCDITDRDEFSDYVSTIGADAMSLLHKYGLIHTYRK